MLELLELTCPTMCTCLFNLRPGVLSKTLSHMWDKLNLPIFLLSVGLITLMNMNSLIFLAKLCPSLPIIWKLLWLVGWTVWLPCWWMSEGSFRYSLYTFAKGPGGFPYVFIITRKVTTLEPINGPTFVTRGSLSLGDTSMFLMVLLPLK